MNHERCRIPNYNKHISEYAGRLGALAINTARTIKHEVLPPRPQAPVIPRSELVILDDETAIIKASKGKNK